MILDLVRETDHLLMELRCDRNRAQTLEGIDQRIGKAVEAVSVLDDTFALDVIEDFANLLRREFVVIKEFDEARDGALEVDVVLPEGVVGVDKERLSTVGGRIGL